MATIGRNKAVADLRFLHLSLVALPGLRVVVHIVFLSASRNRLLFPLSMAWAYLTFDKGARLINTQLSVGARPPA